MSYPYAGSFMFSLFWFDAAAAAAIDTVALFAFYGIRLILKIFENGSSVLAWIRTEVHLLSPG